MEPRFSPSRRCLLLIGVAACFALSGCNKLGYGEPRTAPKGQAILGPKRVPQFNGEEVQRQRAAMAGQQMQTQGQMMPPQGVPMAPMMPPQMMAPQMSPPPQYYPPQGYYSGQNYNVPPAPQQQTSVEGDPIPNPYGNGSQSYSPSPLPQTRAQQAQAAAAVAQAPSEAQRAAEAIGDVPDEAATVDAGPQILPPATDTQMVPGEMPTPPAKSAAVMEGSSYYPLPYDYPPGSYFQPVGMSHDITQPEQAGRYLPVGASDFYGQDIRYAPAPRNTAPQTGQWYSPVETAETAAAVAAVSAASVPPLVQNYSPRPAMVSNGGMSPAYGNYANGAQMEQAVNQQQLQAAPSQYQPMTARQAAAYPSNRNFGAQSMDPQYDNFFYGGHGEVLPAPEMLNTGFSANAPEKAAIRRPLEVPPMLAQPQAQPSAAEMYQNPYYGSYYSGQR